MTDISICCYLDSEHTTAGNLVDFFRELLEIERISGMSVETISLVDDRSRDKSMEIARTYSNAKTVRFEDHSQVRNELMDIAKGEWIFMANPTMRYQVPTVARVFKEAGEIGGKCLETFQRVIDGEVAYPPNFYYSLIKNDPSVRFHGLVFETLQLFPHEIDRRTFFIGENYVEPQAKRLRKARGLYKKELRQLQALKTEDPNEIYWAAMRYSELGIMGCIGAKKADTIVVDLLQHAITRKLDFGPAYFELAKQHLFMKRDGDARRIARAGAERSGYEMCRLLVGQV